MLSILLPSYNNNCCVLVNILQRQASAINGLEYEIIVADDGGDDLKIKIENAVINELPNCRYIIREKNVGRAAIRNYLASLAQYDWLLFIDSDVSIASNDFLKRYIAVLSSLSKIAFTVIDGGVTISCNPKDMRHNLRFWYEYNAQSTHTAEKRQLTPYQHIHTANLLIPRSVMMKQGFDERFVRYGYEDVLLGKSLKERNIDIMHIDNPVGLDKFESNLSFVRKTEEALGTLNLFSTELKGYNGVLDTASRLKRWHLLWVIRLFHHISCPMEKHNLVSRHPSLVVFKLYKLGYFSTLQ